MCWHNKVCIQHIGETYRRSNMVAVLGSSLAICGKNIYKYICHKNWDGEYAILIGSSRAFWLQSYTYFCEMKSPWIQWALLLSRTCIGLNCVSPSSFLGEIAYITTIGVETLLRAKHDDGTKPPNIHLTNRSDRLAWAAVTQAMDLSLQLKGPDVFPASGVP